MHKTISLSLPRQWKGWLCYFKGTCLSYVFIEKLCLKKWSLYFILKMQNWWLLWSFPIGEGFLSHLHINNSPTSFSLGSPNCGFFPDLFRYLSLWPCLSDWFDACFHTPHAVIKRVARLAQLKKRKRPFPHLPAPPPILQLNPNSWKNPV